MTKFNLKILLSLCLSITVLYAGGLIAADNSQYDFRKNTTAESVFCDVCAIQGCECKNENKGK